MERGVTLAALDGAGGSVVGRRVAERLGVELLDREIPAEVARRSGLSEEAVGEVDEQPRSRMARLNEAVARATSVLTGDVPGPDGRPDLEVHQIRGYIEDALARLSASGGVAIGRGGMVVLADVPGGPAAPTAHGHSLVSRRRPTLHARRQSR